MELGVLPIGWHAAGPFDDTAVNARALGGRARVERAQVKPYHRPTSMKGLLSRRRKL